MIAKTFFKKKNCKLKDLFPKENFKTNKSFDKVRPLQKAGPKDLSFFDSSNSGIRIDELVNQGNENTKALGLFLYTDFFIIFQISGFLLLVAMVGAIVLAQDEKINNRSQSIIKQKRIQKKDIIKLK